MEEVVDTPEACTKEAGGGGRARSQLASFQTIQVGTPVLQNVGTETESTGTRIKRGLCTHAECISQITEPSPPPRNLGDGSQKFYILTSRWS